MNKFPNIYLKLQPQVSSNRRNDEEERSVVYDLNGSSTACNHYNLFNDEIFYCLVYIRGKLICMK